MHNTKDYTMAILNPQFTRIKSLVASKTEKDFAEHEVVNDPRGLEYDFKAALRVVYEMIYVDPIPFELRDKILLKRLRIWFYRLQCLLYKGTGKSLKLMIRNTDFTTFRDLREDHNWKLYLICKAIVDNNVKFSNI